VAVPFVQGRLRGEWLSVRVKSECAHCQRPLHLEIDSELGSRVEETGAEPLVFAPMVDFEKLEDPSIIDAF
jgi:hypothetical protein